MSSIFDSTFSGFIDSVSLASSDPSEAFLRSKNKTDLIITFPTKNIPGGGNYIVLPAYIKALKDSFSPQYNGDDAYGRMDKIPHYKSTTRSISLTVGIPSNGIMDANEHLRKVSVLVKNLYPSYINILGRDIINSPPLIRVKFANLICSSVNREKGLLGYLTSPVDVDYKLTEYGSFIVGDNNDFILPKYMEISLNFAVLHEHTVGWKGEQFIPEIRNESSYPFVYAKDLKQETTPIPKDDSVKITQPTVTTPAEKIEFSIVPKNITAEA